MGIESHAACRLSVEGQQLLIVMMQLKIPQPKLKDLIAAGPKT